MEHRLWHVRWTGVPLKLLLDHAEPRPEARFVWTEGLDGGEFGGRQMSCYPKTCSLKKPSVTRWPSRMR
jgi:DMSO/TMAO reductase YedYZ molybdopterin-dependent catalytic subunit